MFKKTVFAAIAMMLTSVSALAAGSSVADQGSNSGYANGNNYSIFIEGAPGADGKGSVVNVSIGKDSAPAASKPQKGEMNLDSAITLETPANNPVPQESGSFWDGWN